MTAVNETQLNTIADQLLSDYDNHNPGTVFASGLRLTIADAIRVQDAVTIRREQRGESVVGYKIGCVSEGNQKIMGVTHPVTGRLWSTEQYEDGIELRKSDFANIAIEAEFAVTLSRELDPADLSVTSIVEAIDTVFPVLELHNLIMRGEAPLGHELIANNAIHAGVVRGAGNKGKTLDIETDLALIYDGETVDSWTGIRWPVDVLEAIPWLATMLARYGKRLVAGDTILVGALGPPIPVEGATRVDVTSSVFGKVTATFV